MLAGGRSRRGAKVHAPRFSVFPFVFFVSFVAAFCLFLLSEWQDIGIRHPRLFISRSAISQAAYLISLLAAVELRKKVIAGGQRVSEKVLDTH